MRLRTYLAVLHKEGDVYVAESPEVGTVSQGKTVEEAVANLRVSGISRAPAPHLVKLQSSTSPSHSESILWRRSDSSSRFEYP